LRAPVNDARFAAVDAPVHFSWTAVAGAARYEWELALDEQFTLSTGPMSIDGPETDLGSLLDPAMWEGLSVSLYWRARAVDEDGAAGGWPLPWIFHKSLLEPPEPRTPADGERFSAGASLPRFSWSIAAGAVDYQLGFALDEEFTEPLGVTNTGRSAPYLDLQHIHSPEWDAYEGTLYWRVAGVATDGVPGPWSTAWMFSKTNIAAPELIAPLANAIFAPESPPFDFLWDGGGPAGSSWQFQIADTSDFARVLGDAIVAEPSLRLSEIVEDEEWWTVFGTYWWRVALLPPDAAPSPWSESRRFSKMGRHRFLAWGDSITAGECVDNGYCDIIITDLAARYDGAVIVNEGIPGAKSWEGAAYIEDRLLAACPHYVLIQFGDNDTVDPFNCVPSFECNVDGHMAEMAEVCREFGCIPVISTLVPINPISQFANAQATASMWSALIRDTCAQLDVAVADTEEWFFGYSGYQPDLYCYAGDEEIIDWVHPNETGYRIMSDCFLSALSLSSGY